MLQTRNRWIPHAEFMDDSINELYKKLDGLEGDIEQLTTATLHIQDCIKILIRIFETRGNHRDLLKLKEEHKELESITSKLEDKYFD